MNRGDTIRIYLDFELDGQPLEKDVYDEIELQLNEDKTINALKLKMTDDRILWDDEQGKYYVDITQEESFKLKNPFRYQLRIMNADAVVSSGIGSMNIGEVLSKEVLK